MRCGLAPLHDALAPCSLAALGQQDAVQESAMARDVRQEPRGFDEQWASEAAEIERWRSVDHGKARELHDVAPPRRPREEPRRNRAPARRIGFTVIAGALAIGGLLLYLLITLSGIG